jgi:type II secretory pathway pseudopilin PulG
MNTDNANTDPKQDSYQCPSVFVRGPLFCRSETGITLVEMIIVLALVGLITAISFPAVTSGLDSVRLSSASDTIVSFLNAGLNRAERGQTPVEIVISIVENKIKIMAADRTRELSMPDSIAIIKVHPEIPGTEEQARSIVLYPNGAIPRFGVEISSSKGTRRIVRVDPITGVPKVENVE